jgi:hypothetical protein
MTSGRAKHLAFLTAAWVWAIAAVSVLVAAFWPSKPAYSGHPLSYWFKRLPVLSSDYSGNSAVSYSLKVSAVPSPSTADCSTALTAIRNIGTNGLPFLLRKLDRRPPPPRLIRLLYRYTANWPIIWRTFTPPRTPSQESQERGQAVAGLLVLCPLPPDAEQKVRALALEFDGPTWYQAGYVLKANKDPRIVRDALSAYQ